ncbi:MAG: alpha-L-fucosidase [Saprospiraceae bacterium]|jgi:alpha-L-fucosidase
MEKKPMTKSIFAILFLILFYIKTDAQEQTGERAKWFVADRFGMFIHWGVYSGAEGFWKGEKLRYNNDYAEWIQYRNRISKEEYLTLLKRFDWETIKPEEWVLLAKKAGMKYVTITAKHHDGFALWDSPSNTYNISNFSFPKRDIIKELAEACKKHGLKLGLYYSHWVDWEHPYGWDHTDEITGLPAENYDQYWQEKVMPQMRELLTNYGDIGLIWFDMWIHHSNTVVTKIQLTQLKNLIRELQPNCLINSRLGLSIEEDSDVDFRTLGDNQFGNEKLDYPWQSPATVAHSWGFHSMDTQWKSTTTLLRSLINNVSLNGNLMLNIGPRANGEVPYEIAKRLEEMGTWLAINGASIYGSEAFDLTSDLHDWGRITCKKGKHGRVKVYLHVFNWPLDKQLCVTGIKAAPSKVYVLADKSKSSLSFQHNEVVTRITLPVKAPDPYVSVLVMEFDQSPEIVKGLVAAAVGGGYALKPENAISSEGNAVTEKAGRFGSIPPHALIKKQQSYTWKIYIDKACKVSADVSYSFQGEFGQNQIILKVKNTTLIHQVEPSGQTVGEPNADWVIENFKTSRLGEIPFDEPGFYEIKIEVISEDGKEIKLNWLWLE